MWKRMLVVGLFFCVLAAEMVLVAPLMRPQLANQNCRAKFEQFSAQMKLPGQYVRLAELQWVHDMVREATIFLVVVLVPGFLLEIMKRWYRRRSRLIQAGEGCVLLIGAYALLLSPTITSGVQRLLLS